MTNTSPERAVRSSGPGPCITHRLRKLSSGFYLVATSRRHRKGLPAHQVERPAHVWQPRPASPAAFRRIWAPKRIGWWVAMLFATGSIHFMIGRGLERGRRDSARRWTKSLEVVRLAATQPRLPRVSRSAGGDDDPVQFQHGGRHVPGAFVAGAGPADLDTQHDGQRMLPGRQRHRLRGGLPWRRLLRTRCSSGRRCGRRLVRSASWWVPTG